MHRSQLALPWLLVFLLVSGWRAGKLGYVGGKGKHFEESRGSGKNILVMPDLDVGCGEK